MLVYRVLDISGIVTPYVKALRNLRKLSSALAILTEAVNDATEEVLIAATEEAKLGGSVAAVMSKSPLPISESGFRRGFTRIAQSKVGSMEVEEYIKAAWVRSISENEQERVRKMAKNGIESGVLDPDAAERLTVLTGLQATG